MSPPKTLIPSYTYPFHTPLISEAFCVRSYCEKKSPRGICYAQSRAVQTLLPRHCFTVVSVIQFRRQKRQGIEGIMHDERGTERGRHFTQMKQQYFNATLCTRTFKIDNINLKQFTSHIAATIAGALLAPSQASIAENTSTSGF